MARTDVEGWLKDCSPLGGGQGEGERKEEISCIGMALRGFDLLDYVSMTLRSILFFFSPFLFE